MPNEGEVVKDGCEEDYVTAIPVERGPDLSSARYLFGYPLKHA